MAALLAACERSDILSERTPSGGNHPPHSLGLSVREVFARNGFELERRTVETRTGALEPLLVITGVPQADELTIREFIELTQAVITLPAVQRGERVPSCAAVRPRAVQALIARESVRLANALPASSLFSDRQVARVLRVLGVGVGDEFDVYCGKNTAENTMENTADGRLLSLRCPHQVYVGSRFCLPFNFCLHQRPLILPLGP